MDGGWTPTRTGLGHVSSCVSKLALWLVTDTHMVTVPCHLLYKTSEGQRYSSRQRFHASSMAATHVQVGSQARVAAADRRARAGLVKKYHMRVPDNRSAAPARRRAASPAAWPRTTRTTCTTSRCSRSAGPTCTAPTRRPTQRPSAERAATRTPTCAPSASSRPRCAVALWVPGLALLQVPTERSQAHPRRAAFRSLVWRCGIISASPSSRPRCASLLGAWCQHTGDPHRAS